MDSPLLRPAIGFLANKVSGVELRVPVRRMLEVYVQGLRYVYNNIGNRFYKPLHHTGFHLILH